MAESDGVSLNSSASQKRNEKSISRIVDTLAYEYLWTKRFGGNKRSIHNEIKADLEGKTATVNNIRFVKTGTRVDGYGSYEDYDPPYLAHEESHKILSLVIDGEICNKSRFWISSDDIVRIEAKNVLKL